MLLSKDRERDGGGCRWGKGRGKRGEERERERGREESGWKLKSLYNHVAIFAIFYVLEANH